MKIVDITSNSPPEHKTNYEIAKECLDACYADDNTKEFFLLTVDTEGVMGVYSSMEYPPAYMALDAAKEVLMEYYREHDENLGGGS